MKKVLILGGSSGIGKSCVNLFKQNGWYVFASYYSHEKVTNESLLEWFFLDIRNIPKNFLYSIPKVDAVVITIAKNKTQSLEKLKREDTQEIFETNIFGQLEILQLIKSKLNNDSSIVLFGSTVAQMGFRRRIAYGLTKAVIQNLTSTLAVEYAPHTRVNCVIPGYIKTEQYIKNSGVDEKTRAKKILLGRLGEPEEVAKLVFFLSTESSSYINGESVTINGGFNYDYEQ